jgi:hypothetical protein
MRFVVLLFGLGWAATHEEPKHNIIYANTVVINGPSPVQAQAAHVAPPITTKKPKKKGLKLKILLSMMRAATNTYLEEKKREKEEAEPHPTSDPSQCCS